MSSIRRKQAEELFQVAVDLPIEKRAAFLDQRCDSDADLRSDVDDLLEAHDRDQDDFLAVSPFPPIEELLDMDDSVEPETEDEETPQTLSGHYHIERELGHGGMGVVYLAHDTKLDRDVAIKMLPAGYSHDPARLTLFEREARTAGNLNHPNIGTIYEFGEHEGQHFIVMEYVEGDQLGALLQGGMPLALREFIDIAIEIAQGLTAAHDSGVVHRDLKPGNVMRTGTGSVKILDFGLAKAVQEGLPAPADLSDSKLTPELTSALGTAGYSSPEQCRGEPADFRSDLFSFGVVLYELITGRPPFKRDSFPMTIQAVLKDEPEPPNAGLADVPPRLANLITKLLSKRPEDRCQSSAEVLAELKGIKYHIRHPYLHLRTPLVIVVCLSVLGLLLYSFWPEASRLVDGRGYKDFVAYIEDRDLVGARAELGSLEEHWSSEELDNLTWTLEFFAVLDLEDFSAAQQMLEEPDRDWSGEDTLLVMARAALNTDRQESVDDAKNALADLVAWGRFEDASKTLATIEELAPDEQWGRDLWNQGKDREEERNTRTLFVEGLLGKAEKLSVQELTSLSAKIDELDNMQVGTKQFKPARDDAIDLRQRYVRRLEDPRFHVDLELDELEYRDDQLSIHARQSSAREAIAQRMQELREEGDRKKLRAEAVIVRFSADDLYRLVVGMLRTDPERQDPVTREVETLHEQRKDQKSSYDEARRAFEAGGEPQLRQAFDAFADTEDEKYRVVGLELFPEFARRELEELKTALDWFSDYRRATKADPIEGRDLQAKLAKSRNDLAEGFTAPAAKHLDDLELELTAAEKNKRLTDLFASLDDAVELLLEVKARKALTELVDEGLRGPQIDAAGRLVTGLEERKQGWKKADDDYDAYRRLLKEQKKSAGAERVRLELKWEEERRLLAQAFVYEKGLPLERRLTVEERERRQIRHALLNLRLGDFDALRDEDVLETTAEGLILLAQARYATAPSPRTIGVALEALDESTKLRPNPEQIGRVAYLRGVLLHELSQGGLDAERLRADAALALGEAVEDHGFNSADAYFRLAAINLDDDVPQAIKYALQVHNAEITEEEIIVALGGNSNAVLAVTDFRQKTHHALAQGYLLSTDWQKCIDVCDLLIQQDKSFAPAFAYRGGSRLKLGDKRAALDDFTEFRNLRPPQDELWDAVSLWAEQLKKEFE